MTEAPPAETGQPDRPSRLRARIRSHMGSIAKALSWRVTAGIDTFIISYLVTGSVKGAGSIAAMELLTKIALFWAHERAWIRIGQWKFRRPGRAEAVPGASEGTAQCQKV